MPPLSPEPAELSSGSMSACRKSWAMVSPSARARLGAARARRRSTRASRATSPRRSSPTARRLEQVDHAARPVGAGRSPTSRRSARRRPRRHPSPAAGAGAVAMECRTSPRVSTRRARASGCGDAEERALDAHDQLLGRRGRPLLERALRQHAGESAVDDHAEERAHRVGTREAGAERPGRVLAEEGPLVGQQADEHPARLAVEHLGEGVGRGDRGQLVVAAERLGEHPDGADARDRARPRRRGRRRDAWRRRSTAPPMTASSAVWTPTVHLLGGGTIAPPGRRRCCG